MQMQCITLNLCADCYYVCLYVTVHGEHFGLLFLSFNFKLICCFSELERAGSRRGAFKSTLRVLVLRCARAGRGALRVQPRNGS